VNSIYKFFKSTRLAIVLILVIILFALLSTLIPQGKTADDYKGMYSAFLFGLISMSGLENYTGSILFWVPTVMFILNLGVCTVDRLVKRARNKAVRHFGPDLIHIALLILAVGALITASMREEQDFTMGPGDAVNLPGGYSMSLTSFDFLKYPDGRPKAWISTVDVKKGEALLRKAVKIEVNHPLEIGSLKIYQTSYANEAIMDLTGSDGKTSALKLGQGISMGDSELWFASTRPAPDPSKGLLAQLEVWKGQTFVASQEVGSGDKLATFVVGAISAREVTGLRAATDPGFIPVLIALIIGAIGLTMTSIHKSKGDI